MCVSVTNIEAAELPSDSTLDNPNDWYERDRERYRLRIGLRGTLADDWFFGIRVETSNSNRSTNVTFGADSPCPFSKLTTEYLWVRHISVTRVSLIQVYRRQNATAAHNHIDAVGRRYQS